MNLLRSFVANLYCLICCLKTTGIYKPAVCLLIRRDQLCIRLQVPDGFRMILRDRPLFPADIAKASVLLTVTQISAEVFPDLVFSPKLQIRLKIPSDSNSHNFIQPFFQFLFLCKVQDARSFKIPKQCIFFQICINCFYISISI